MSFLKKLLKSETSLNEKTMQENKKATKLQNESANNLTSNSISAKSNDLRELKRLFDEGVLTEAEFNQKKKQILGFIEDDQPVDVLSRKIDMPECVDKCYEFGVALSRLDFTRAMGFASDRKATAMESAWIFSMFAYFITLTLGPGHLDGFLVRYVMPGEEGYARAGIDVVMKEGFLTAKEIAISCVKENGEKSPFELINLIIDEYAHKTITRLRLPQTQEMNLYVIDTFRTFYLVANSYRSLVS